MSFEAFKTLADLKQKERHELPKFCHELRQFIVESVLKTGGHLGASLGVIELTVALHYVFDSPADKIIWDVGHQSYPHKVLTGRKDVLHTVRKSCGISGFTSIKESEHDVFGAGHSSTSISVGLGIAAAMHAKNQENYTIPVIGDGAMSAGLAFEALNNAKGNPGRMIVVLNDNDMSISPPTGAISKYLPRLANSTSFKEFKTFSKKLIPESAIEIIKKAERTLKNIVIGENIFEAFGLCYCGPVDGHDVIKLVNILESLKADATPHNPILLHVKTEKGKGYAPAESSKDKLHAVSPSSPVQDPTHNKATSESYSAVASRVLCEIASQDSEVFAITPAMKAGSMLSDFSTKFPERFFDVGIAEQHAVAFSGGLAVSGLKPYCFIYSTFLQRAYDQVIHDICLQNLPVRFMIDRAGVVGEDGPTHHGVFDIAFLRILPNIAICSPSSKEELEKAIIFSRSYQTSAFAIRFPRGPSALDRGGGDSPFEFGKGRVVAEGKNIAILTVGVMLHCVFEILPELLAKGITPGIIDLRFIKPIDETLIINTFHNFNKILLVEDGTIGGVSSILLEVLHRNNIPSSKFHFINLPDQFIEHASINEIHTRYKMRGGSLMEEILRLV